MGEDEAREVGEDPSVARAVRQGSEVEFVTLVERHRRELRVHCYRMLGNLDDADDVVQGASERAWRAITRTSCSTSRRPAPTSRTRS